jgi:hypothetical protein
MQTVKNRKGLALGAIFGLVASLFVSTPASAATANNLTLAPSAGTSLVGLVSDDFALQVTLDASVASSVGYTKLKYKVTHDSTNYNLLVTTSNTATVATIADNATSASRTVLTQSPLSKDITPSPAGSTNKNTIAFRLSTESGGVAVPPSTSTTVKVTVVAYIDNVVENDALDAGEWSVSTVVELRPWSALGATVALTQPISGATRATASAAVTSTVNLDQLDSVFTIGLRSTNDGTGTSTTATNSAQTIAHAKSGAMSASADIASATASPTVASISAVLYYGTADTGTIVASQTLGVSAYTIDGLTFSPVVGDNLIRVDNNDADSRINSTFTIKAEPYTGSGTVVSVATNMYWTTSFVLSATKYVVVNGVTYTGSSTVPTLASPTALAAGSQNITVQTVGLTEGTETITFKLNAQNRTEASYVVTARKPAFVLSNDALVDSASAAVGTAVTVNLTAKDQFGVVSNRTNQRVSSTVALGGSTSDAVLTTITAGKAAVTVTPVPSTRTGSATVTFNLQSQNVDTGVWATDSTYTMTLNVTGAADSFTSRTASVSASLSYGVVYSWSPTITVKVANSYSAVVVSAPGLVIQNADDTTVTGSATLTLRPNGQTLNVKFAGGKTGTATVTFTNGSATTTSQVVFDAAPSDKGTAIAWDTTAIESGKTRVVTGTLTDANGNPVDTTRAGETAGDSGTASLVVEWSGTGGIVVGTLPTETDANGKFRVSVLTSATDQGSLTITATYNPQGASTATAKKVTSVQVVNVTPAVAPEVNAVIGTFNGRWAVRVENAKGSVVSVKAGSRWVKYTSLNNNYLFSMKSVKGRTLAVSVWVDGELQNSQTITIK